MSKLSVVTAGDYVADDLAGIEAQAFLELLLCCSLFLALYHTDPNRQYDLVRCHKKPLSDLVVFWLLSFSANSDSLGSEDQDDEMLFELESFFASSVVADFLQKSGRRSEDAGRFLYQLFAPIAVRMSQSIICRVDERAYDARGFLTNVHANDSKSCEGSGQCLTVVPSENPVLSEVMVGRQSGNVFLTINPGLSSVAEVVLAELAKKAQPDVANDSGFFDQINTSV